MPDKSEKSENFVKAPYTYFGSKRSVAKDVWERFGKPVNYIEPFVGSMSVLLANPNVPKIETVNDIDHALCNFWRAIQNDPEKTAQYADFPVNEADLHAIHKYLVSEATAEFKEKMITDPNFYDCKMAGWWAYGICASIPGNWLFKSGLNALPLLSSGGGGIHGLTSDIPKWFKALQERTRKVRVACGDWKRICTPSVSYKNKGLSGKNDITAIFLDPPYSMENRYKVYKNENDIFKEVCDWAVQHQDIPNLRLAVCGYDGDYEFDDSWEKFSWQANGGLANHRGDAASNGKLNKKREVIYFNKNCIKTHMIDATIK